MHLNSLSSYSIDDILTTFSLHPWRGWNAFQDLTGLDNIFIRFQSDKQRVFIELIGSSVGESPNDSRCHRIRSAAAQVLRVILINRPYHRSGVTFELDHFSFV